MQTVICTSDKASHKQKNKQLRKTANVLGDSDRESNRMDRWIMEVIQIRKEQDKSMN